MYDFTCEWHNIALKFPKRDRYTLGDHIFSELLAALKAITKARYSSPFKKLPHLFIASEHINTAVILVRMTNSLEILPEKRYLTVAKTLNEIGNDLGGWIQHTQNQPPQKSP